MDNNGYVYILINPAMAEMVKVGMTTRDPEDRVEELSSATGVPNQFILVYKEHFNDCVLAEKMVHEILEGKGYRVAQNREFFSVPIPEAINVVQEVKKYLLENKTENSDVTNTSVAAAPPNDIEELIIGLLQTAKDHYYGTDDTLQDYKEATKIFKKASKLGSGEAYRFLGDMILDLDDTYWYYGMTFSKRNRSPKVIEKALDCYKQGEKNGDRICLARMGNIYSASSSEDGASYHLQNSMKCWGMYIEKIKNDGAEALDVYNILRFLTYLNKELRDRESYKRDSIFEWVQERLLNILEFVVLEYYSDSKQILDEFEQLKSLVKTLENPKVADLYMIVTGSFPNSQVILGEIVSGAIYVGDRIEIFNGGVDWDGEIKTIKSIEKLVEIDTVDCDYAEAGELVHIKLSDTTFDEYEVLSYFSDVYMKGTKRFINK
ncbi:hypothetical protein bcgnr5378_05800 [Bacillus cereus]|uniref:Bacteriophage T5 Orf172 DNA-binding domain-containing protein n=1 Tax=Bacillus cereus TaxID=1396 RepID=A0A164LBU6_BACCE|nr:GIY-YIG nuclease family protein [Bacillus cereus]KZD55646.1 hypothetical protein B4088_5391 [Bacillus cereus]